MTNYILQKVFRNDDRDTSITNEDHHNKIKFKKRYLPRDT